MCYTVCRSIFNSLVLLRDCYNLGAFLMGEFIMGVFLFFIFIIILIMLVSIPKLRNSSNSSPQVESENNVRLSADYDRIYGIFCHIRSEYRANILDIQIGNDPIDNLKFIPAFEERKEQCKKLLSLDRSTIDKKIFDEIITSNIQYKSSYDSYGKIEPFDFIIFKPMGSTESFTDSFFNALNDELNRKIRFWDKKITNTYSYVRFQETLNKIAPYEVSLSDNTEKPKVKIGIPDIKYTNITAKTNFGKLGNFVVIDTETTGLSAQNDEIIEVAAIRFENWEPVQKFETLIKPDNEITSNITGLTGITNDMVASAPKFTQITDSLSEFIGTSSIIGHNLPFDIGFLYYNGYDVTSAKRKYYDTLTISRKNIESDNYKLVTLCKGLGIRDDNSAHRAVSDCLATGLLFKRIADHKASGLDA